MLALAGAMLRAGGVVWMTGTRVAASRGTASISALQRRLKKRLAQAVALPLLDLLLRIRVAVKYQRRGWNYRGCRRRAWLPDAAERMAKDARKASPPSALDRIRRGVDARDGIGRT